MININNLQQNKIEIDEDSYKNNLIFYIGYVRFKDLRYVKFNRVNPLYLIIEEINGYFEEISWSKFDTTSYQWKLRHTKKYEEPWKNSEILLDQ